MDSQAPRIGTPVASQAADGDQRKLAELRRNRILRLYSLAMVTLAAAPVIPVRVIATWLAAMLGHMLLEAHLGKRSFPRFGRLFGAPTVWVAVAILGGAVNVAGAWMFWDAGSPTSRLFAIIMICVSLLYNMMLYYPQPKLMIALSFPHLAVLWLGVVSIVLGHFSHGTPWLTLTTIMSLAYLMNFIRGARTSLAVSRQKLLNARAEAQEKSRAADTANQAKSAFLATMSHEIRTPLNGVLGMAQAVLADDLPDEQRSRVKIIRQSGETLLALLNDILDLSKIAAGKLELENIEFDLSELVGGCCAGFTSIADKKALNLISTVEGAARGVYFGDPTRVRQILNNLVSNALKFTEHGEVRLWVDRAGEDLIFVVNDSGIGMSEAQLSHLFQRFEQADVSTTRRFGGTGLGLAICKEIAEILGGDISVASAEGRGTTFTVRLPLRRVGEESSDTSAACEVEVRGHEGLRVLVAEDNSVNQLVIRTLLNQIGIDPVVVADGEQAVLAWQEQSFDVVLMDVQMPVMDGICAARAIRTEEVENGRRKTPIIALTANAMAHHLSEYAACGMDAFVAKPIGVENLYSVLDQMLAAEDRDVKAA